MVGMMDCLDFSHSGGFPYDEQHLSDALLEQKESAEPFCP